MESKIITDISDFIFVSDEPKAVDAIFLPGSTYPLQPEYAAKLYADGYAKWIIPSGGLSVKQEKWTGVKLKKDIYDGDYQSDCEFFYDVLIKNGVPSEVVICEDKSGHTRDNAFLSRKVLDDEKIEIKTAMIICKGFHARRCLFLYQMAFPHVDFIVCPIFCYNIRKDNWFQSEKGVDRVLGELARCGNQFVPDIKTYLANE